MFNFGFGAQPFAPESSGMGKVFYVAAAGNDNYEGIDPSWPFASITYALTQCEDWRNDVIIVMNNTSANEAAFPIVVDVNLVHIIGRWSEAYPNPTLVPTSDAAVFQIIKDWVEIAGLELGAGANHGCIESPAGPGTVGHWWIHHCSFGYIVAVTTGQDGIWVLNTHDAPQCVIEDCIFGSALTRDGIRMEGKAIDMDADGALLVQRKDKTIERILAGDISLTEQ